MSEYYVSYPLIYDHCFLLLEKVILHINLEIIKKDMTTANKITCSLTIASTQNFHTKFSKRCAAGHGGSSELEEHSKRWKSIWEIQSLGKMKIVVWRMAHDCLPTGYQLRHRNIPADDQCVFCGRSERVEHLFLTCPFAQAVWDAVRMQILLKFNRSSVGNMQQCLFDFLAKAMLAYLGGAE
jgi:hypothetical protein